MFGYNAANGQFIMCLRDIRDLLSIVRTRPEPRAADNLFMPLYALLKPLHKYHPTNKISTTRTILTVSSHVLTLKES